MRPLPSLSRMLARGWVRRCPRCGQNELFRRWFRLIERCPGCGLKFEREEGAWLAAAVIGMGFTQTLVVAFIVVSIVLTWPDPPIWPLIAAGAVLTTLFAAWVMPRAKLVWVAIELFLRSGAREDLEDVERFSR